MRWRYYLGVIRSAAERWREYLGASGVVGLTALLCLVLRARLQTTDVAMLLLLAVVFAAGRWRMGAAVAATLLSIAVFDFVFVPPYYTFDVAEKAYFLTFAVMFVVALVMGRLTARIRDQAHEAAEGERRAAAELALTRELAEATGRQDQVGIIARHLARALGADSAVPVLAGPDGGFGTTWPADPLFESVAVRVAALWAFEHGQSAGAGTAHCAEAEAGVVSLKAGSQSIGVVVVGLADPETAPSEASWRTATALTEAGAAAMDRALLAEDAERTRLEVESERLRTALLSSLSHDLRTPLATIEGAASSLLQDEMPVAEGSHRELVESILAESRRMTRLVGNLLEMVRVEAGSLAVKKAWQPLEEPLGVALLRLEEQLKAHPLRTRLPSDLPLVPVDELLLEQVFLNLLENGAKYTPAGTPIEVAAWQENGAVIVEVADQGPGVPEGAEREVFRKFFRGQPSDGTAGAGLGLTICEGIVSAHGGRIWVERGSGGGASFRFTLPLEGPPLGAALSDLPDG